MIRFSKIDFTLKFPQNHAGEDLAPNQKIVLKSSLSNLRYLRRDIEDSESELFKTVFSSCLLGASTEFSHSRYSPTLELIAYSRKLTSIVFHRTDYFIQIKDEGSWEIVSSQIRTTSHTKYFLKRKKRFTRRFSNIEDQRGHFQTYARAPAILGINLAWPQLVGWLVVSSKSQKRL